MVSIFILRHCDYENLRNILPVRIAYATSKSVSHSIRVGLAEEVANTHLRVLELYPERVGCTSWNSKKAICWVVCSTTEYDGATLFSDPAMLEN